MSKNKKKKNTFFVIIGILLIILSLMATSFLIYFEIIPVYYLATYIIVGGIIVFYMARLLLSKEYRKWVKIVATIPSVLLILLFTFISLYSLGTIGFINDIMDRGLRSDTYSIYVLSNSSKSSINDLNSKIIGVYDSNDETTIKAIEKISNKIEFNEAVFNNVKESADALLDKKVDGILALDSSVDIMKENDPRYATLKPIYTFTINSKVISISSNKDISKENFIVYISGIDTSGKVATKARSDVNLLLVVNPKEKKVLMINTPRDYYIKLHSKKEYDKLTHAGIYGVEESIHSLEDLYNIKIDYYARINFTTFMNIINSLDGIEVDVPISFCEQTSSRTSTNQICLKKGKQVLNGEQALALSRTRYTVSGGDRGRGKNQMLVLEAIINKAMSPSIIIKYNSLLSSISDSLITNIDIKSMTKLIKNQIKNNTPWTYSSFSVDGKDSTKPTYSTGGANAYVMEPDEETIKSAIDEINKVFSN